MKTIITQIIQTVQGEGPSVGTPVLLIRTGNCNLECTWCDTKWSNNLKIKDINKFDLENVSLPFYIDDTDLSDFMRYLDNCLSGTSINRILLTGGEPLINKKFVKKMVFETDLKNINSVEIETNGVLLDNKEDDDWKYFDSFNKIIQINISPKLNPKYYKSKNIKTIDDIIQLFNDNYNNSIKLILEKTPANINWKFVYSKADEERIEKFISGVEGVNYVQMMPLTPDYKKYKSEVKFLEDFRKSCYDTIEYCLKTGYIFVPRVHIFVFNSFKHQNEFEDVR